MKQRFDNISMNGRMAYVIMCTEAFLKNTYPHHNWTIISEAMWKATKMNWADWSSLYAGYIPHVLFSYKEYGSDLIESFSEEVYKELINLYTSIPFGMDRLDSILNKPHEMAMVYEGTSIGDGRESIELIEETEKILIDNHIPLPASTRLSFANFTQKHGWGDDFDGSFLSIIL